MPIDIGVADPAPVANNGSDLISDAYVDVSEAYEGGELWVGELLPLPFRGIKLESKLGFRSSDDDEDEEEDDDDEDDVVEATALLAPIITSSRLTKSRCVGGSGGGCCCWVWVGGGWIVCGCCWTIWIWCGWYDEDELDVTDEVDDADGDDDEAVW